MEFQDLSILVGGQAGQGVQTVEKVLAAGFRNAGLFVFTTQEFMSRIRGGSNSLQLRVSSLPVRAPRWACQVCLALDPAVPEHLGERIGPETLVLGEKLELSRGLYQEVSLEEAAKELGSPIFANVVGAGLLFGLLDLPADALFRAVEETLGGDLSEKNRSAAETGLAMARNVREGWNPPLILEPAEEGGNDQFFCSGSEGVGLGALAGGCTLVASYPMSPSTGVLSFLAARAEAFGVTVEQAEDEIAGFQMGLGAWFCGGRGLTTTSGGGFALMGEGVSLAGMTETPMVVYLAQRPGPATGLPTRTAQGDLNLALHSGHGTFPRILLAPGDPGECFTLGKRAFDLADKYQSPVILLSDQYLADSRIPVPYPSWEKEEEKAVVKTEKGYRRYLLTDDGLSPRGVPGYGEGIVRCDSDEHTEEGLITEEAEVRNAMVRKRLAKERTVLEGAFFPWLSPGWEGKEVAVVGWGSTRWIIDEALKLVGDPALFQAHYFWVHPLDERLVDPLKKAQTRIVVENNETGQFADLLALHGVPAEHRILKYDGWPFAADQLAGELETILKERK